MIKRIPIALLLAALLALGLTACTDSPPDADQHEQPLVAGFDVYATADIAAKETGAGCPNGKAECNVFNLARIVMAAVDTNCTAHDANGSCIASTIDPANTEPIWVDCGFTDAGSCYCAISGRHGTLGWFQDYHCDGINGSWFKGWQICDVVACCTPSEANGCG